MERNEIVLLRLTRLADFIAANPGVTVDEVSVAFGRTRKQIKSDIDSLLSAAEGDGLLERPFSIDYDLYVEEERLTISPDVPLRNTLGITAEEATFLLGGLEIAAATMTPEERSVLPGLIAKIVTLAAGTPPTKDLDVGVNPTHTEVLALLRRAIQEETSLDISYRASNGDVSHRRIDPTVVYQVNDGWVTEAWCQESSAWRSFRIDRILSCVATGEGAVAHGRRPRDTSPMCTVVLSGRARWRIPDLGADSFSIDDDQIHLQFRTWDEKWLVGKLLWMAEDIVSVSPPRYLEMMRNQALTALAEWSENSNG